MAKLGPSIALLGLLAIGCYATWGSSQHRSDHPREQQRPQQAERQPEGSATKQEPAKSFWRATMDDPINAFTGLLAVFTAALAGVSAYQLHFLRRADETARISANAATAALTNLAQTERAVLSVVIVEDNFASAMGSAAIYDGPLEMSGSIAPFVVYAIKNYGKTPAFIRQISDAIELLSPNPPTTTLRPVELTLREYTLMAGGQTENVRCIFSRPPRTGESTRIRTGKALCWFQGSVVFDDIYGTSWEYAFIWKYDGPNRMFRHYYTPNHTQKAENGQAAT